MRQLAKKTEFWGFLIFASLALNLLAAWHFPAIPSALLFTNSQQQKQLIPETALWHQFLEHKSRSGCRVLNNNTTSVSEIVHFYEKIDRFVKDQSSGGCFLPPSTSCDAKKFSVVVVSQEQNPRNLFLSLLTFMSYGHVQDISWIGNTVNSEVKNKKYKDRIEKWVSKGRIKFIPMNNSSLWTTMQHVQPQSEAVVWIYGDNPKDWKLANLKENFALWREDSRSIVPSHVDVDDTTTCMSPSLHGLFMSREYLCYLKHPLIYPLQSIVEEQDTKSIQSSISLVFKILSDGHLSIPSHVPVQKQKIKKKLTLLDNLGCDCSGDNGELGKTTKLCPS